MEKSSQVVMEFLAQWLEWAERFPCETEVFTKKHGLCDNLYDWLDYVGIIGEGRDQYFCELRDMFKKDELNRVYPFGQDQYKEDNYNGTQHLNPDRLRWVRQKLNKEV